ncbi:hypothetical protein Rsub_07438 [Raphidocelis subcapitata]|uniref:Apple domain-containing protein n=1 Tax=Raphidocelis subcapitata TaxID=307507 RepID=A0A2V0PCP0_9CHLO|nr:hypothetical protein Rsub_07438 [Raphidocelis subcapitata]|eukprot:GBF94937.1 hypothetical protein Rsub_07438 [Raphidocelis subcapitata]
MAARETGQARPRRPAVLAALLAGLCAGLLPAAAAQCSLGLNFQPPGAPNVPYSWTVLGQAALKPAGNNDTGRIAPVRLAAAPVPVLHVLPAHPLVGAPSSCVSDCLPPPPPAAAAPARRLMQAEAAGPAGDEEQQQQQYDAQSSQSVEVPLELIWELPLESQIAPEAGAEAGSGGPLSLEAAAGPSEPAGPSQAKPAAGEKAAAKAPADGPKTATKAAAPAAGAPAASGPGKAPPPANATGPAPDAKPPPRKCAKSTDPGTLLEPASWSLSWSLDGGAPVKAGPFQGSKPAEIRLDALAGLPKGQHNLSVTLTLHAGSASVSGAGALPAANMTATRAVSFLLVDPSEAPDPTSTTKSSADPAADSVASKYWCALSFNVGGAIVKNKTVERAPEDGPLSSGAFQCARECNKMGPGCGAFGVVGADCYLMSKVNVTAGGADSLVTAMCMKNVQDWNALGAAHGVAAARDRYYCLPTFDVQGGPAGQSDEPAAGAKPPVTDFPLNTDPLVCAASCSATQGCEYFVQIKPAGCYLKSRPFDSDGRFGTTGPSPSVDVSCFRGEDAWLRAGSILDAALPQLRAGFAGGVLTGSVAGAAGLVGNATAATYYCAREYSVNGTVHSKTDVGEGAPGWPSGGCQGQRAPTALQLRRAPLSAAPAPPPAPPSRARLGGSAGAISHFPPVTLRTPACS